MTRWIIPIAVAVSILMLGQMLLAIPDLFAQVPGGSFERMAAGHQKAARAIFEAQKPGLPRGARPLTLDELAERKQGGEGWVRIYESLKSRGLVEARNLGEAVNDYDRRHQLSSAIEVDPKR